MLCTPYTGLLSPTGVAHARGLPTAVAPEAVNHRRLLLSKSNVIAAILLMRKTKGENDLIHLPRRPLRLDRPQNLG